MAACRGRHPCRAAVALYLAQRLSPALADAVLSIRRLAAGLQRADRPDTAVDNLAGPVDGPGRVHGSYPGPVLRRSPFTTLLGRRRRPAEVAGAAVRRIVTGR